MNKTILIDRNNLRQSIRIMKEVTTNLKNNIPVVIFPQGTRNKNMEFKAGSLKYVHKSQGDILPLGIKGTDNVLKGFFSYQKKTVELFINPLIKYEDFKEKNLVQVNKNIEKLIKEQVSG